MNKLLRDPLLLDRTLSGIAIVPYSQNVFEPDPGEPITPVLSTLSRMAVDAAAELWNRHSTTPLVIAGEYPFDNHPTTAELMRQRLSERWKVPKSSVTPLEGGFNWTGAQVDALEEYFSTLPEGDIALVALAYHAPRVKVHSRVHDRLKRATVVPAEAIFAATGNHSYEPAYGLLRKLARQERVLRILSHLDRSGRGPLSWLASRGDRGSRIVDVVEGPSGLQLERRGSSKRKLVELQAALA